jgi:hypothetical protein
MNPTTARRLNYFRHERDLAERSLWRVAREARENGATLAEIAKVTGVAIETARRKLANLA